MNDEDFYYDPPANPVLERAFAALARGEAALAPRDPDVVARAAAWEANMPKQPESRSTTGGDAVHAMEQRTMEHSPQPAPQRRAAPAVSMATLEVFAQEIGKAVGAQDKTIAALTERVTRLEAENVEMRAKLVTILDHAERALANRHGSIDELQRSLEQYHRDVTRLFGDPETVVQLPRVPRLSWGGGR